VPDAKYLVNAGGIDESFAATLACSALTAYSASAKLPELGAKDRVAVIGCGGVGLVGISSCVRRDEEHHRRATSTRQNSPQRPGSARKTTLDKRSPDTVAEAARDCRSDRLRRAP